MPEFLQNKFINFKNSEMCKTLLNETGVAVITWF